MAFCRRCGHQILETAQTCPQCGAALDVAATGMHTNLPCPRCQHTLESKLVGDVLIDECAHCLGLFLDDVAVKRVVADRQQARAEALLGALPRREVTFKAPDGKLYIKCPTCKAVMNRKLFAVGSGVIIDVCRSHGTFFDAGELPAIIDFVMHGGLEQAAKKELERMRNDARRERENAQHAQLVALHGSAMAFSNNPKPSPANALVDLLFSLFS